jgi:hypothetical protein
LDAPFLVFTDWGLFLDEGGGRGGATWSTVDAAAPTEKKIKNRDKYQLFTIFIPINRKSLHP